MITREKQLSFSEANQTRRRSRRRRRTKRLTEFEKPGVVNYWLTQKMLKPFLKGAESFRTNFGAQIATYGRQNVEERSAEGAKFDAFEEIAEAIDYANRKTIPAKDVIDSLYSLTRQIARNSNDSMGWTATYFGEVVDMVIERYPRDKKYGEDLKRKALNYPLNI